MRRGRAALLLGQAGSAQRAFDRGLELEPGNPELQLNSAAADLADGQWEAARGRLRELIRGGEAGKDCWLLALLFADLATAESRCGCLDEALRLRLQLLELAPPPSCHPPQQWLGWAKEGLGAR